MKLAEKCDECDGIGFHFPWCSRRRFWGLWL